jgi:putative addiction module component (TIGR02574 family)
MISVEEVLNYALALPPADREVVAAAIQDSLDTNASPAESIAGNEFYEELRRRSAAFRAGQSQARPAVDVMAEAFQRQADEKS